MNGSVNKILAGALVVLLSAAVIGSYTAASRLASLEATVIGMDENIGKIDDRVTWLERGGRSSR